MICSFGDDDPVESGGFGLNSRKKLDFLDSIKMSKAIWQTTAVFAHVSAAFLNWCRSVVQT